MRTTDRNGLKMPDGDDIDFPGAMEDNTEIIDDAISKCNFYAGSDPLVTDDSTKGYSVGSLWFNGTSKIFQCIDPTANNAIWKQVFPAREFDSSNDLNVSTSDHGLCPKAPNDMYKALLGNGAWGYPLSDGWIPAGETWTYASAEDPTFTFTVSGDKTTKYYPGMRLKLTQTTAKYFIVTKVTYSSPNTTVTIYGGTDYDLTNATITNPFYSMMKAPAGFPLGPDKWTVTVTNTSQLTQTSPTAYTWYNLGVSINVPIGVWIIEYGARMQVMRADEDWCNVSSTFSTTTNSQTDSTTTLKIGVKYAIANSHSVIKPNIFRSLTAKTTYYLLILTDSTGVSNIEFRGDLQATFIKAVCAYL